ncbi:MAG: ComF family protein [Ruminococcaceae bacterium]|nr:ComF family protein [Oscillospiraceae bacterium]
MKLLDTISALLFPPKCLLCRKVLDDEELDLCHTCRVEAPECPISRKKLPFVDSWAAVWYYEDWVRRSILRYKFYGARSNAHGYGRHLAMKLQREHPEGFDLMTWVPISSLRRLRRGYDQVELLADAVGKEMELESVCLLKKTRNNRPQSGITGYAQRRANVLGVYRVTEPELVQGKRVLLLDDVITTGATASECARVLLTAGAKEVHCGAVAAARHQAKK